MKDNSRNYVTLAEKESRFRCGLTLFEVLIVVVIIGVLVGLLLPSLQHSRELARRRSCENNIRQLWLATEAYRFSYGVFPAGTMSTKLPVENFPDDNHQGWLLRITPELAGGINSLSGFDYSRSVYDPVNWPTNSKGSDVLLCVSSPGAWAGAGTPVSNYVGVYDGRDVPIDESSRGVLVANRFLVDKDIDDGMQNTIVLGEASDSFGYFGWTSGTIETLRTLGIAPQRVDSSSLNVLSGSANYPYGWCLGDNAQSYKEFVDKAATAAWNSGERPIWFDGSAATNGVSDLSFDEKERFLSDLDYNSYLFAISEDELDAEEIDSDAEMNDLEVSEFDEEDEYYLGMGFGMDSIEDDPLYYPIPRFGTARLARAGLTSYHTSGVNVGFLDGRTGHLSWTIDQKVYSSFGIRDDGMPLTYNE